MIKKNISVADQLWTKKNISNMRVFSLSFKPTLSEKQLLQQRKWEA